MPENDYSDMAENLEKMQTIDDDNSFKKELDKDRQLAGDLEQHSERIEPQSFIQDSQFLAQFSNRVEAQSEGVEY